MGSETKVCTKCGIEKPLGMFYIDYKKNKPKPACKECISQYQKDNKEAADIRKKRWLLNHPDIRKEVRKRYYNKPEIRIKYSLDMHNKILKRNGFEPEGDFTAEDWKNVLIAQDNKCACCGKLFTDELKPTVDCIIPLSKGGSMEPYNVQALCLRCNDIKKNMEIRFISISGNKWWFRIPRFAKLLQTKLEVQC